MRTTAASVLAMASTVSAHAMMHGVWVNGEDQGDGRDEYIRTPPDNGPVKDLASPEIVCGPNGANAAPSFVSAAAGDTLSFEWFHNTRDDDIIDGSHIGPIITYIAEYTDGDGTGPIWTKIAEDGFDGSEWAVDRIRANNGLNDFELPAGLAAGQYLIRQEIIAHHESETSFEDDPDRGAQFYPSCVQVEVTSGGSDVPDQGFDFNTGYTYADPGIVFDPYGSFTTYDIPGPAVWAGQGGGAGGDAGGDAGDETSAAPQPTQPPSAGDGNGNGNGNEGNQPALPSSTLITVTSEAPAGPSCDADDGTDDDDEDDEEEDDLEDDEDDEEDDEEEEDCLPVQKRHFKRF